MKRLWCELYLVFVTLGLFGLYLFASAKFGWPTVITIVGASLPDGIAWFEPGVAVARGEIAQECLPRALATYALEHRIVPKWTDSPCPGQAMMLGKIVAAVAGDEVAVSASGVSVNGRLWPMSTIKEVDDHGHRVDLRLGDGSFRVPRGEVLLLGWSPDSWDGRYWGPVPLSSIRGRIIPIVTNAGFFWKPNLEAH